jgi:hypothetical protein
MIQKQKTPNNDFSSDLSPDNSINTLDQKMRGKQSSYSYHLNNRKKKNHEILEQLEKQNKIMQNYISLFDNKKKNEIDYEREYEIEEREFHLRQEIGKLKNEVYRLSHINSHHIDRGNVHSI